MENKNIEEHYHRTWSSKGKYRFFALTNIIFQSYDYENMRETMDITIQGKNEHFVR